MPDIIMPEVLEHPSRKDARIVAMDFTTRAAEGDAPIIEYVGSDNSEDRYGSIVDPKGADISPYMRSGEGVFCFAHRYDIPTIGKCVKLDQKSTKLVFRIQFAVAEFDFAATIYRLVKGGYMSGSSIGFIPKEWEEYEAKTVTGYFAENRKYTKWELLELSAVPVPANRNALKLALSDKVVSENELRAFGLDAFIRGELLYIMPRSLALVVDKDGKPIESRTSIQVEEDERGKKKDDETCPDCGKPLADCTCEKDKGKKKGEEAEKCPECGKPMAECVCDKEKSCAGCGKGVADCKQEKGCTPVCHCGAPSDAPCTPECKCGLKLHFAHAVALGAAGQTRSWRTAAGLARAGAVLSTKNRARVERARASAKAAYDELDSLLVDAFPEDGEPTLDDAQGKAAEAARAKKKEEPEVCPDCGKPLADCTCVEDKKKAKKKGEPCATCGSPDCADGDACTAKGCGCCEACTATKKKSVDEGEENRCVDDEGMRTIISGIRSLTSPTGEAGTTAEDIEGSSTADGDRSNPDAAEKREGYSPHLKFIMGMK
jgi:hypothetical protein